MEQFLAENSLYVVLIIVLMIWAGLALLLMRLEKRVTELQETARGVKQHLAANTSADEPSSSVP